MAHDIAEPLPSSADLPRPLARATPPLPKERRELDVRKLARHAALWTGGFVLLIVLVLPSLGLGDLRSQLVKLDAPLLVAVLGLSLLNYLVRSIRWQALSKAVGLQVPFARNSLYYVTGFAFGITPGKVGELVRLWLLRRHHRAPYERTVALLVMDRVTDGVPLLALCILGSSRVAGHGWSLVLATAIVAVVVTPLLRPGLLVPLVKLVYARVRRRPRLFGGVLRTLRTLRSLVAPRILALALVLGLVGWSAEILGASLVLHRLGANVDLVAVAFIFAFAMLVGSLPLFPGGVGGTEGTMIAVLLLLGTDTATAVTGTAIIRLATLGFAVALGFLALPLALLLPLRHGSSPSRRPSHPLPGNVGPRRARVEPS